MVDTNKITEKASEMAGTAAQAAGPALGRAKEIVTDLVERAAPLVDKAAHATASGVATAAGTLDKATKGKYSERIDSVSSKIESKLDRKTDPTV